MLVTASADFPTYKPPTVTTASGDPSFSISCITGCGGACEGKVTATVAADGKCTRGDNGPMTAKAEAAKKQAANDAWSNRQGVEDDADAVCGKRGGGECYCHGNFFTWLPDTKCYDIVEPRNQCVCEWTIKYIGECEKGKK